jgi:hypothetical protein
MVQISRQTYWGIQRFYSVTSEEVVVFSLILNSLIPIPYQFISYLPFYVNIYKSYVVETFIKQSKNQTLGYEYRVF